MGLKIPGHTEAQFLAAMENVVARLAHGFVFGIHTLADMRQQCYIEALDILPKYQTGGLDKQGKPKRALENFLYVAVKNRLKNFRRDNWMRNDPPCALCHDGRQSEHPDGQVCARYRKWKTSNKRKSNLAQPGPIDTVPDETEASLRAESDAVPLAEMRELEAKIDAAMPVELRSTYLKMRAGQPVLKGPRLQVEEVVRGVIGGLSPA